MLFRLSLTAIALACLGSFASPAATLTAGSNASAISASFVVNGKAGALAPQALASGSAPPAYSKATSVPSLSKSQQFDILTLTGTGKNIKDTATGTAVTLGKITSKAGASIGSLTGTVGSPLGNVLTITGTKLVSSAGLAKTADKNTPTGTVSIGSLSINAPAFGISNKSYSGKPKPNFILYQSGDKKVTLYLNRQIKTTKSGKVTKISVSAVNLHIVDLETSGQTISGDLFLATGNAH